MSFRTSSSLNTLATYSAVFTTVDADKVARRLDDAGIDYSYITLGNMLLNAYTDDIEKGLTALVAIQVRRINKPALVLAAQAVYELARSRVQPGDKLKGMRCDDFMSAGNLLGFLTTVQNSAPVYFEELEDYGQTRRVLLGEVRVERPVIADGTDTIVVVKQRH